jgi:ABC-type lipoprotein export system ATPase subunit
MTMTKTGTATTWAVATTELTKTYGSGDTEVRALDAVNARFERGRFTAIMGPSGSGKSTLMHCAAGLDTVTSGSIRLGDTELTRLSDRELTRLRRKRIGFTHDLGQTIVMVTHDPVAAGYADRVLLLADGQVAGDIAEPTADSVLDHLKRLGA